MLLRFRNFYTAYNETIEVSYIYISERRKCYE